MDITRWAAVLFLAQLGSTLFLTGLIWFVQVVHYALFPLVGDESFRRYEQEHARRTGWVVFPPMLVELISSCAVAVHAPWRLPQQSRSAALALAALVLLIWLSTAAIQVPLHNRLGSAPSVAVMRRLLRSNWIRTVAWTMRSALLLGTLAAVLRGPATG